MNIHHLELFYSVARHGGIMPAVRNIPYGIQQSGQYFMTTVRAGSAPGWNLEFLGLRNGAPQTLSYARVALSH